jgi:hypothetical protein
MATKFLYILPSTAVTPNFWGNMQDGGTAPTAANTAFGYAPGKLAANSFCRSRLGATGASATTSASSFIDSTSGPTKGTGTGITTAGDSFIAGPFTGTFAATAWTFDFNLRATVAGCVGRMRCIVWKSANADGSSATKLTASTLVGATITMSTTANVNSNMSWSPGAITLNNEYLFFQLEWQETTTGSSNTDNVLFRVFASGVTTPDFAPPLNAVVSQTLGSLVQALTATSPDPRTPTRVLDATVPTFPSWTFTRSGTGATHFNSSGVLTVSTADTPRITYKYNGTSWVLAGMYYEPARSNLFTGFFWRQQYRFRVVHNRH